MLSLLVIGPMTHIFSLCLTYSKYMFENVALCLGYVQCLNVIFDLCLAYVECVLCCSLQ